MRVGEISTSHVVTLPAEQSVLHAARVMREQHVGDVVVVNTTPNGTVPIGILTDRDIVVGILAQGIQDLEKLKLSDAIGRDLEVIGTDDSLSKAMHIMRQSGVRRLPVVNALGILVGIVTYDDVVRRLAQELADFAGSVTRQDHREHSRRTQP